MPQVCIIGPLLLAFCNTKKPRVALLFLELIRVEGFRDLLLGFVLFPGTIMTWVLLFALMLGSVLAYALTPLTKLVDHTQCSNTTLVFTSCSHGNATLTR